jgi:hypothetical protein
MRIWDLHPGFLNRQSLLGEHRELHGILSILRHGKAGYSRHPETLRWRGHLRALQLRHDLLAAEMALRGYRDATPVRRYRLVAWPGTFVDHPGRQLALLGAKYEDREPGRIPLPRSAQELWARHKLSVLARGRRPYEAIGRAVAGSRRGSPLHDLALRLVLELRRPPAAGGLRDALFHMWGFLKAGPPPADPRELLARIQAGARRDRIRYLLESSALSELAVWLP